MRRALKNLKKNFKKAGTPTKHDVVLRIAVHVLLVQAGWEKLHVATATVDVLLVFHRELHHQRLVAVAEGLEAGGESVEPSVLAGLDPWGSWDVVRRGD